MSIITEHVEREAATRDGRTCEAIWTWLGIEAACGETAAGLFRRACIHEHVRDGWMCAEHARTPETGLCRTCWELPGEAAHECPISIAEVTA